MFTRIDHVGIAVPDLDEALEFYARTFDLHAVHQEVNEEQGVREAMLAVGDGDAMVQLRGCRSRRRGGTIGPMDREQQTDLLPLLEGATSFDVVLRGYDRHQVHEHLERLEADLRIAIAERDATAARTAEFAGQLAAAQ